MSITQKAMVCLECQSLTKVLLAILLHGDLHFALGGLAMGITVCRRKRDGKTNQVENSEKTLVYLKQCEVQIIHRISFISSSVTVFSWSEVVDSEYWSWGGNTPWMGPDNVYQTQEPGIESSFSRHLILALWCCTFKCISEAWMLNHFTFILFYTLFLGPAVFFLFFFYTAAQCCKMLFHAQMVSSIVQSIHPIHQWVPD